MSLPLKYTTSAGTRTIRPKARTVMRGQLRIIEILRESYQGGGSFVLSNVRESDKMKLQVEYVDISTIKPYKGNAKEHPKEQIEQIKKSMQEFGNIDNEVA